jgi:hypothetical protein
MSAIAELVVESSRDFAHDGFGGRLDVGHRGALDVSLADAGEHRDGEAPTFTVPGGGPAVDPAAGTPVLPTYVVAGPAAGEPALAAHPATATTPRQAASRENDRRSTRTITASREGITTAALDAARPASVPLHSRQITGPEPPDGPGRQSH